MDVKMLKSDGAEDLELRLLQARLPNRLMSWPWFPPPSIILLFIWCGLGVGHVDVLCNTFIPVYWNILFQVHFKCLQLNSSVQILRVFHEASLIDHIPPGFISDMKESCREQALDLWPASFWPAETSGRRSADATTRPGRQPDCHDAGHHRPGPVLLQRQADDREGPSPACTLKQTWAGGGKGWAIRRYREAECGHFLLSGFQTWTYWAGGLLWAVFGDDDLLSAFRVDI